MEKDALISAILSKDTARVSEAKTALKEMLSARSAAFRADAKKFVSKSIFENCAVATEPGSVDQPTNAIGNIDTVEDKDGFIDAAKKAINGEKSE